MAKKKSTRPNLPEETLARARAELYGTPIETAAPKAIPSNGSSPSIAGAPVTSALRRPIKGVSTVTLEVLRQEYTYVLQDLQNMFILAAILVTTMIVAALVLL